MSKKHSLFHCPDKQETIFGWIYLAFMLMGLPGVLSWFNAQLRHPLADPELNFLFYGINFLCVLLIFHDYLSRSAGYARHHFTDFIQAIILGYVAYYACAWCMNHLFDWIAPGYSNANDASIATLSRGNFFLMAIGTVVLVPPVEECFYRGLIFRGLYNTSPLAAYLISMAAFSLVHIIGYIQAYSPWQLVLCFLQYLPAGLCLAWSYAKSGTLFAPIVIHALVNAMAIYQMR